MKTRTSPCLTKPAIAFVLLSIMAACVGCGGGTAPPVYVQPQEENNLACCEPLFDYIRAVEADAANVEKEDDNTSTRSISLIQEIDMGDTYALGIEKKFEVKRSEHVEAVFERVVEYADRPSLSYDVRVLGGTQQLNAFSILGGRLYITEAFIEALELTDGELAFIIGHEIAHAALRHLPSHMEARHADFYSRLTICQAARQGKVRASAVVPTFEILDMVASLASMAREFEADQYGALYAMQAGYNFSDAISALKKLRKLMGETSHFGTAYGDVADRLSGSIASLPTHPPTSQRLEQLERFRNQIAAVIEKVDDAGAALAGGDYARAEIDLTNALKVFPESRSLRMNLALASHLAYRDSATPAIDVPGFLTTPQQFELSWRTIATRGRSSSTVADGEALDRAIDGYRETLRRDPEHALARNNLAVAYLDQGEVDLAIVELNKAVASDPEFAMAYKNLTVAYGVKLAQDGSDMDDADRGRISAKMRSSWAAFNARNDGMLDDVEYKLHEMVGKLEQG